ncbi:MAG: 30S ribosomal protein S16 [Candidatus Omnitrophica bacterium]|nr:30S ribosomal protein S16 [Candidatus Omnitrophota bacterium]
MAEVVLRMKRLGTKKTPFFRIVAIQKSTQRDGKVLEEIGLYDPKKKQDKFTLEEERAKFWLKNGAVPSNTVKSIFKKAGI